MYTGVSRERYVLLLISQDNLRVYGVRKVRIDEYQETEDNPRVYGDKISKTSCKLDKSGKLPYIRG